MLRYLIYELGALLAQNLPQKVAYAISRFLFYMHYIFFFRDRRAVRNNLIQILGPQADIYHATKDTFRNFGIYMVEFLKMRKKYKKSFIDKNIEIVNIKYLNEALAKGHGVIAVTAHIGNWELAAAVISSKGYDIHVVALPHTTKLVNDFFNRQREAMGLKVISTKDAPKRCLKVLRENKILGIVAERDFGFDGEELDFLGKKVVIPRGVAVFAQKTKAAIVPTFLLRNKEEKFVMIFDKPIYPEANVYNRDVVKELMKKYVAVFDRTVRKYPTQWLMFREFGNK